MKAVSVILPFVCMLHIAPAEATGLDRQSVDKLLGKLGADSAYDPTRGVNWSILPGPFYTPELKMGLGMAVAGIYRVDTADKTTQNSSISFTGFVSSSGALGIGLNNYTFFNDDRWRLFVEGSVNRIPTAFWGIGYDAAQGNEQDYRNNSVRLHPIMMRQLVDRVYLGTGWDFSTLHAEVGNPTSRDLFTQYGAGENSRSSGPSVSLNYDTRDSVTRPQHGQFLKVLYTWFDPSVGSDTHFSATELQMNHYLSLDEKTVLAFDLWGRFTHGNVPWDRLSMAGDDRRMRGYYQGRYRDKDVVSGQVEFRQKLSWRHGYVLWFGAGALGCNPGDLDNHPLLPTAGAGYRFEVKPAMNVRLDLGIGKESAGFYFQIAEAF